MNDLFTRLFRRTKANEDKVAEVGVRTAAVTVNMANQSAPTIYSIDGSVSMTLTFSS